MPVKHDADRRWVELELLVPGTPEQVWHAIATGPGISAWFTRTEVEEHVGGKLAFDFGSGGYGMSSGLVTAWQPPVRFAYEEAGWNGDAPPCATEIVITARNGNTCVMRMVHSLFTREDTWDDELESFEKGWPGFFWVLCIYLRDFPGCAAAPVHASGAFEGTLAQAWKRLAAGLGLAGVDVGDVHATREGTPALAGTICRIQQEGDVRVIVMRTEQPAGGVASIVAYEAGAKVQVAVRMNLYGDDASAVAARVDREWQAWMAAQFPA